MSIKKMAMILGAGLAAMLVITTLLAVSSAGTVSEDDALSIYNDFSINYSYTTTSDPVQFGRAVAEFGELPSDSEVIEQTLTTYTSAFSEILPQLQADEIYTLLLFSNDLNNYKSGKNENALYRKDAALNIIEKYGITKTDEFGNVIANENTVSEAAATTVDEEGNIVEVTEDAVLATDLSKLNYDDTIYGNIVTRIETGSGLNMVNDSDMVWDNTTGINTLSLGEGYPSLSVNGIRACYQYTGEDANLEFSVSDIEDLSYGEYAVYDDYADCLRNNKSISREFTNGYSTDENNNKGQADGTIKSPEVSETVLVKNGQYVNMYNTKANLKNYVASAVE